MTVESKVKDKAVIAMAPDVKPGWLTLPQICQHTQSGKHTIRQAVELGRVEVLKLGPKTHRYRLRAE